MHMFQLGQCLIERGHKVVVMSNTYSKERLGVRYVSNGMKVYHLPLLPFSSQDSFASFMFLMCILRKICIREQIDIVHGHQTTALLNIVSLLHGATLGKKVVFTDHSLFGFSDAASININKVLKWIITNADACICVSHVNKDNLSLRAAVDPSTIYVIPNAVDTTRFQPDLSMRPPKGKINIVVVSRMMYRKGVDLLIDIIPEIIKKHDNVHFILGGDGDKLHLIHAMRDKYNLADRMEILGRVPHHKVREVLCRGHIFLNTSLTEAFCIAILEAASCGLLCVSTNVGGVPEVLPPDMVYLAPARPKPMIEALEKAIDNYESTPSEQFHERIKQLYSWRNVAERVEHVYDDIHQYPCPTLLGRIKNSLSLGWIAGIASALWLIMELLFLFFWEWMAPDETIERATEFDYAKYMRDKESFGDHTFKVG